MVGSLWTCLNLGSVYSFTGDTDWPATVWLPWVMCVDTGDWHCCPLGGDRRSSLIKLSGMHRTGLISGEICKFVCFWEFVLNFSLNVFPIHRIIGNTLILFLKSLLHAQILCLFLATLSTFSSKHLMVKGYSKAGTWKLLEFKNIFLMWKQSEGVWWDLVHFTPITSYIY